jgi:ribosomal protein S18 acetylase RimI-like enzyme
MFNFEDIQFRPVAEKDYNFGYLVKKETLKNYVEETWGCWDEENEKNDYHKEFTVKNAFIIIYKNIDVGWLECIYLENTINLHKIYILSEYQNKGIGSKIIKQIINEGKEKNIPVIVKVLKCNIKAQKLYEKLGFKKYDEAKNHFFMKVE